MQKFTHIDQFYTVVREQRKRQTGPVTFQGTIKLHGANGAVALDVDQYMPQSRNQILPKGMDNAGFARFIRGEEQVDVIRDLEKQIRFDNNVPDATVTLFGEWCGPGVNKGCGIHKIPSKIFVIFAAVVDEVYLEHLPRTTEAQNEVGIYDIFMVEPKTITVDFSSIENTTAAGETLTRYTLEAEQQCPFATLLGVEGIGEGWVWTPQGRHRGDTSLFFKTKGKQHRVRQSAPQVQVDPAELSSMEAFVKMFVTPNRLQQGLDFLRETGLTVELKNIGQFLRWISNDVKREGAVEMETNNIAWRKVNKMCSRRASAWYQDVLVTL